MEKLISDINIGISKKSEYVKAIARPEMLISALTELHNMTGNNELKDDVAAQVVHLIANKMKRTNNKPLMLHSLLCGPPGVGKTTIGIHLARIWYSLGYIGENSTNRSYSSSSDSKQKQSDAWNLLDDLSSDNMESIQGAYFKLLALFIIISLLVMIWGYVYRFTKTCYQLLGLKWLLILFSVVLVILFIVFLICLFTPSKVVLCGKCKKSKCVCIIVSPQNKEVDLIKIVSAEDFIGQYVGWTEQKTTKILQESKGKVLFIDEAYSLVSNSNHDTYGEKALAIINRYMSEHPEELIVIMAGYRDKIQNLFNVQPGLASRFMWSFSCNGYNIKDLFTIWKQQIQPWKLSDEAGTYKLFEANQDIFPNYARDTSKLVNFCYVEHDRDIIGNQDCEEEVLTPEQVKRGISMLRRNTIVNTPSVNNDEMMNLLKSLAR